MTKLFLPVGTCIVFTQQGAEVWNDCIAESKTLDNCTAESKAFEGSKGIVVEAPLNNEDGVGIQLKGQKDYWYLGEGDVEVVNNG